MVCDIQVEGVCGFSALDRFSHLAVPPVAYISLLFYKQIFSSHISFIYAFPTTSSLSLSPIRTGMGGGGCRGVFTWSASAFPFVTQTEVLTMPWSSQEIENDLRRKEITLSKFWKEN